MRRGSGERRILAGGGQEGASPARPIVPRVPAPRRPRHVLPLAPASSRPASFVHTRSYTHSFTPALTSPLVHSRCHTHSHTASRPHLLSHPFLGHTDVTPVLPRAAPPALTRTPRALTPRRGTEAVGGGEADAGTRDADTNPASRRRGAHLHVPETGRSRTPSEVPLQKARTPSPPRHASFRAAATHDTLGAGPRGRVGGSRGEEPRRGGRGRGRGAGMGAERGRGAEPGRGGAWWTGRG